MSDGSMSEAAVAANPASAARERALAMAGEGASLGATLAYLTAAAEAQAPHDVVASVLLLDAEGRLRTGAAPKLPADYNAAIDGLQASPFLGTCSAAAATGKVVLTPDIDADPKWSSLKGLPLALGLVAAWSQPILGEDGRVLGTFGSYFRQCREPTEAERALVKSLAETAAILIAGAR